MTTTKKLYELRKNYQRDSLDPSAMFADPMRQFEKWFDEAFDMKMPEPNAMILSTSDGEGRVSSRTVLLKSFDDHGFVFYTNYNSHKARELLENPSCSLLFLWIEMERQIRIEGIAQKTSSSESDEYFASRPRESQIAAWSSDQSNVIESKDILSSQFEYYSAKFRGSDVERPPFWGGFKVKPDRIEFWQGQPNRLHDRIVYLLNDQNMWEQKRLSP